MSIRKINFTVKEDGITPATEQRAGIQSEHGATWLIFGIDDKLYLKLQAEKGENSLVYRFDCYDSVGGTVRSDTMPLNSSAVTFNIGENLTRHGGKAAVYLVISAYSADNKTEFELLSYPAKLRFENIPSAGGDNGEERESLSTLAETAKNAAESALSSKSAAETAQSKTELAQRALENGSEFFFDGGDSSGHMGIELVTDSELSISSENPIMNKAVALKFGEITALIASSVAAAKTETLLSAHPIGSIYTSTDSTSPADLFGGTWERIKGKFIWGIDDGETAGVTGGEKEHTLTEAELPNISGDLFNFALQGVEDTVGTTGHFTAVGGSMYSGYAVNGQTSSAVSDRVTFSFGSDKPHNNMPPYYGAYVWRRIA